MPLRIVRNDITKMNCDAIVNAANSTLLGGGGVDGAIHKAAGKKLLFECMKLRGCRTGKAKITGGYELPCKYVIHTVGPFWKGGRFGEEKLLRSCYRESLKLAKENGCETVAFPLISAGAYGYPRDKALQIAVDEIGSFLLENDMTVYIVVFDQKSFDISHKLVDNIREYIDEHYVEEHFNFEELRQSVTLPMKPDSTLMCAHYDDIQSHRAKLPLITLDDALKQIDESFSQMLLRKIDEKGMTDSECYKKANVDRKLFSKIRSDVHYKTSKTTAIAFAIALELDLDETNDLLRKAGFALSHSNKFDIIIEYFIVNGNYNIFEINEALFAFDQVLLGA